MFKQLKFRITAVILFATFLALLIIGSLSFYISEKSIYNSNSEVVSESSNESVQMIDEYMKLIALNFRSGNFSENLADEIAASGSISEKTVQKAISYCSTFEEICEYAVLSTDKSVIFSYICEDWQGVYENSGLPDFAHYVPSKTNMFVFLTRSTKSDFNMVLPLFSADNLCGYQLIRISESALNDILKSQYSSFGTTEWHCFIYADGSFVTSDERESSYTQKYADDFKYRPSITSDKKFFAIKSQAKCGLSFVTLLSAESYKTSLKEMVTFLLLSGLSLLVIAFVIATVFAEGITKRLSELYKKITSTARSNQTQFPN